MEGLQMPLINFNESQSSNDDVDIEQFMDALSNIKYSRWSPIDEGVTLAWRNLSVYGTVKKNGNNINRRIINDVTGAVKAGSLVALMGASGSGKSTLMSALAYRYCGLELDGEILINGRQVGDYMKYLSGFMYQEDLFTPYLTVMEHMNIMANLKLDRRYTDDEKRIKINKILRQLGIFKCRNTRIGGTDQIKALSGGEKKRLAFASEMLTDPPIMFCDEPTTGLDSYSAQKLVKIMSMMAMRGTTILCTIHQPSMDIFSTFSQIILLAEGRIAYMGATANALEFFQTLGFISPTTYSPPDFFIKTIAITPGHENNSKQTIKYICDHYSVSDYAKKVDVVVQYEFHMGRAIPRRFELRKNFKEIFWHRKFCWLTYRWFLEVIRDSSIELTKIAQRIIIATIVGLCYLETDRYTQSGVQSIQGVIFLFVSENTFAPMYSVLAQFPETTSLFLREYKSGLYNSLTYYLSRVVSLIPGFIVEPILFVMITYWLTGLRRTLYAFFMTALVTILTMNVASACGILFANAFNSVPKAMSYLVPIDYALMITSGIFIKLSSLPMIVMWTKYLSWLMYSTESISVLQWQGVDNIICETQQMEIPCMTNGSSVLERYGFSEGNVSYNIFDMLLLLIGFYFTGYLCLWWKIRKNCHWN